MTGLSGTSHNRGLIFCAPRMRFCSHSTRSRLADRPRTAAAWVSVIIGLFAEVFFRDDERCGVAPLLHVMVSVHVGAHIMQICHVWPLGLSRNEQSFESDFGVNRVQGKSQCGFGGHFVSLVGCDEMKYTDVGIACQGVF